MTIEYEEPETYGETITSIAAKAGNDEYRIIRTFGSYRISRKNNNAHRLDLLPRAHHYPMRYDTLDAAKRGLEKIVNE